MILEIFKEHNDEIARSVGTRYAAGTLARYQETLRHTSEFIKWKYHQDDLEIERLDDNFVVEFTAWYADIRDYSSNSISKNLSNFKKIVRICVKKGWLATNPFDDFIPKKQEHYQNVPTESEVGSIRNIELGSGRLAYARDAFLFCWYAGQNYSHVRVMKRSRIIVDQQPSRYPDTSEPTGQRTLNTPLAPRALEIYIRYQNHPQCISDNSILPLMSEYKLKSYLKVISGLTGIDKDLSIVL